MLQNEVIASLVLDSWNIPGWFHWHQIDAIEKEGNNNVGWMQRMSQGKAATIIDCGFGFFRKFYMQLTFTFETDKHSVANLLEPPMFSKLCWHICGYQPLWIILWFFDSDNLYSFIFATQSADVNTNDALVDVLSDLNVPKCSENNFSKIIKFQRTAMNQFASGILWVPANTSHFVFFSCKKTQILLWRCSMPSGFCKSEPQEYPDDFLGPGHRDGTECKEALCTYRKQHQMCSLHFTWKSI